MNVRRMMGVAALGAAATTLALVPGAGAQTEGPAYTGSSSGEALNLSVFGEGLTVGSTLAELAPGTGTAQGSGLATPVFEAGATSASETEPGSAEEIAEFCSATWGTTCPMTDKSDVNGEGRTPLFAELTAQTDAAGEAGDVAWNFEKFLVSPAGEVVARFRSRTEPEAPELVSALEAQLPR